jgi:hypothetical protein
LEALAERARRQWLTGAAAREKPAAVGIARVHVRSGVDELEEQPCQRLRDGRGRVAQTQVDAPLTVLPVVLLVVLPVVEDVLDGELDDPGDGLGEQQQQAGGDACA